MNWLQKLQLKKIREYLGIDPYRNYRGRCNGKIELRRADLRNNYPAMIANYPSARALQANGSFGVRG